MKEQIKPSIPCYLSKGDVILVNLGRRNGSEQQGNRLCVVVQNNIGNTSSPTTIVVPLTSSPKKTNLPTHHNLFKVRYKFLNKNSVVLCEQIVTIDKKRIEKILGTIDEYDVAIIDNCIDIALGQTK